MNFDQNIYELLEQTYIEELRSEGFLLKHRKSGARIVLLSNDDENKVFSIGFRTPPPDSTGVPHILEHSVLCGSDKYPIKDPFIELAKGSLNTFLNAMTYPDKTVYPVASCNDVDFRNLTDVYLDAVFHPLIGSRREVFLQEGWHYELEDADAPLTYNGVVYNEMKGAYSSPDDVLERYCINSLYPDTSYGTESGGDPADIPDLSYEDFVAFHQKLYHPSNSYIYIYGNCDMEERLNYLDTEYLSKYDYLYVDSELLTQQPFAQMRRVESSYSVTEEEGTEQKTYLAYNVSVSDSLDKEVCLAFGVLDYALFSAPGAPVKQALIDAGIGEDVYSSYESGIKQPMLSIIAKNTDADREEEFLQIIRDTLTKLVKEGINRQALEAGINSDEFKYREADFGRFPKGLMYGLNLMDTWLYDEKRPFDRLALNETYQFLKDNITTGYFEQLTERYLLNNPHASLVVLKPVVGLTAMQEEAVAKKLADYKASLTKEQIDEIVAQTAALKQYQAEPTPEEDLKKIPLLERKDISEEIVPLYNAVDTVEGVTVDHHALYTNGIGYLNLCFNICGIADEDIPYVGLLGNVLGYIDTAEHSYDELSNIIDIHTGGVFPDFSVYQDFQEDDKYTAMFQIKAKALLNKFEVVFRLAKEMIFTSKFDDYKRLKEILAETKARLQSKILSGGHVAAVGVCMAQMGEGYRFSALTSGMEYYQFISDLLENFEEKKTTAAKKLRHMIDGIFAKDRMIVSFTADDAGYLQIKPLLAEFIAALPEEGPKKAVRHFAYDKVKVGYKTASQVNYVARCGNFKKAGLPYEAALKVFRTILNYDYLWNNIRVMGGAYGCMNGYSVNGAGYFVSYRDPHCKATNQVYELLPKYVEKFDVSEREMTKYIIGTFSELDIPLSPSAKGSRSFDFYMRGVTEEFLREDRKKVLSTEPKDIRALKPLIEAILAQDYLCVIGNSEVIAKDKELFDEVKTFA